VLHFFIIFEHQFYVRVFFKREKLIVNHPVVIEKTVDVSQQAISDTGRAWNSLVDEQCSAEVSSSLQKIFCAKVVLSEWAFIIAAETAFHRKDVRALEFVKQGHTGRGLFVFLVAEPRVVVYKKRADARQDEGEKS
jgi:hypothetical protein